MALSLRQLMQRAAAVDSSVQVALNYLNELNEEEATFLSNNWEELYNIIFDVESALDAVISDIEK